MRSDTTLRYRDRALIIDTRFYKLIRKSQLYPPKPVSNFQLCQNYDREHVQTAKPFGYTVNPSQ